MEVVGEVSLGALDCKEEINIKKETLPLPGLYTKFVVLFIYILGQIFSKFG